MRTPSDFSISTGSSFKDSPAAQILFFLLLGSIAWFRVWLAQYQPLFAIGSAVYDDYLFIRLAQNILNGEWLGTYDSLTLIKGPFFSLWVAGTHLLNIPLLTSAQILYSISCLLFVAAVRPLVGKDRRIVFLFCVFLLGNPASFDADLTRATRDLIYPSLTLLVISCTFGVFFSIVTDTGYALLWGACLGISYGCFWLTREEGIWILPALSVVAVCAGLLFFRDRQRSQWWGFIKPWLLSILCSALVVHAVSLLNYIHYGVYAKTELDTSSFQGAYGALSRVKPSEVVRYVPVTKEMRRRIYRVSPAFKELQGYLEGPGGEAWAEHSNGAERTDQNRNEILGGWFVWAFRDAVASRGYYERGKYPEDFYTRLADEVNEACDSGALDCFPRRISLTPVWYRYYARYWLPSAGRRMIALATFQQISVHPIPSEGTKQQLDLFQAITHETIWQPGAGYDPTAQDRLRLALISGVLSFYQMLLPWLSACSIITYVVILYQSARRRQGFIVVLVLSSLLMLVLSRILLLALIDTTSWSLPPLAYLHPSHGLWLAFVFLTLREGLRGRLR